MTDIVSLIEAAIHTPSNVPELLHKAYDPQTSLPETVHQFMLQQYQRYLAVGGMPAAVLQYVQSGDLAKVLGIQRDILHLYRSDVVKYAPTKDAGKILELFAAIPSQLSQNNRRFMLNQVLPKTQTVKIEECFLWLKDAGIALPCYNLAEPQPPLKLNEKRTLFKLFFLDPGLLTAASTADIQYDLLQGNLSVNQGSILENAVACRLQSNGFGLWYYNSKSLGELDFVIQNQQYPTLLEVKSGKDWTVHRSLERALAHKDWKFSQAIVLCKGNVKKAGEILYLPFYMTMFLVHDLPMPVLSAIDWPDLDLV